jgi:hypothetical protein
MRHFIGWLKDAEEGWQMRLKVMSRNDEPSKSFLLVQRFIPESATGVSPSMLGIYHDLEVFNCPLKRVQDLPVLSPRVV